MQGFTPWELSAIKYTYHRHDQDRKGYWDRQDLRRICDLYSIEFTDEQLEQIFSRSLDEDGDEHISFNELMKYLSSASVHHQEEKKLRTALLGDYSSLMAGAAVGLIPALKGKLTVIAGSLFYDPIRLFRDYYVEYHTAIEAEYKRALLLKNKGSAKCASELGMWQLCVAHARVGRGFVVTFWWLVYAILLDTAVGAMMFVSYARIRKWMYHENYLTDRPITAEFAAGCLAGAVSGVVERPAKFLARATLRDSVKEAYRSGTMVRSFVGGTRSAFSGLRFALVRHTLSHGCFFTTFFVMQEALRQWVFSEMKLERTSWKEALVVVSSGCSAGGAFKLVSVPLTNVYVHTVKDRVQTPRDFMKSSLRHQFKIARKGTLQALCFTMPITGVAFLLYEAGFIWARF